MLRSNLDGTKVEALFVILHYLSHFTLGPAKIYFLEAYAYREVRQVEDLTHTI